jgi:8-oxo-dGTP pyrophosphatase MutT (NUDIX family)
MEHCDLETVTAHGQRFPVSVKGILFWGNRVPLLLNERDEWELPGGRLEAGETPELCACRELKEELSLDVQATTLVDSWVYEVLPGKDVLILAYLCDTNGTPESLVISNEHKQLGIFEVSRISTLNIPSGYVRSIMKAWIYKSGSRPREYGG